MRTDSLSATTAQQTVFSGSHACYPLGQPHAQDASVASRRGAAVQRVVQKLGASRGWRRRLPAAALVCLAVAAQGCREDEQDRPLVYDKGTYQGQADQELGQDQVDALRQRATRQQM